MSSARYSLTTEINVPREALYRWHCAPAALPRLVPPWKKVEVLRPAPAIEDGARALIRLSVGPVPIDWEAEHYEVVASRQFRDRQVKGPFQKWDHLHLFEDGPAEGTSLLTDSLEYEAPLSALGNCFAAHEIEPMFRYRHEVTKLDLERLHSTPRKPIRVLISGAGGMIGSVVKNLLLNDGHEVWNLTRKAKTEKDIEWDPDKGELDWKDAPAFDAVIHLAGESIDGIWTEAKRERILRSRENGTRTLVNAIVAREQKPKVFISASGINIYPENTAQPATEAEETTIKGFLADVCHRWETVSLPIEKAGIRRVVVRTGMVLSPNGGGLAKMLPIFKSGLGGKIGTSQQRMSWIALDDIAEIYFRLVFESGYDGVVNAVAPGFCTNEEFTRVLGKVIGRPTLIPVPATVVKTAFGEMGQSTILADLAVAPEKLIQQGYEFRYGNLKAALNHLLGRET